MSQHIAVCSLRNAGISWKETLHYDNAVHNCARKKLLSHFTLARKLIYSLD